MFTPYLLGSEYMDINYFLSVLGLVLVIEGLPYFASPATVKKWVAQIPSVPDRHLRILGFLGMTGGMLLLYWVRSRLGG